MAASSITNGSPKKNEKKNDAALLPTATVILENMIISHATARVQVLCIMGQYSIMKEKKKGGGERHKKRNLIQNRRGRFYLSQKEKKEWNKNWSYIH